jgi:sortase (surface protein transpeptidase)
LIAPDQLLHNRLVYLIFLAFFALILMTACSSSAAEPAVAPAAEATVAGSPSEEAGTAETSQNTEVAAASAAGGTVAEIEPYPLDQTTGPVRVQIPEINLDAPIIAMGWRVEMADGKRTTVWDVPLDEAGWHINSAGAGGQGNTIVSGRQVGGSALFAPLALGSVAPGQEVLLTDGDGIVFVYRITEVTDPIPVTGATPDEIARAAEYFAPTTTARLTLVTGWPEFTTTHRIFAVAEFVGVMR